MTHPLETVAEALTSVLCDPEGECCIEGSDADKAIINKALTTLRAYIAAPKPEEVQEALGFVCLNLSEKTFCISSERSKQHWETIRAALEGCVGWRTIETCPKAHGVDYRLWDADDFTEVVTWFGDGEWCREGRYTHWQPTQPPAPKEGE